MSTKEVLMIEGYSEDLLISVYNKTITIQNTATDATYFHLSIGAADWEQVKMFVDEKLKSDK